MSEGTRGSRIGELTRRLMEEIATPELSWPDLDPYPATVDEVADEIARFVLELEDGPARGVAVKVRERLDAGNVEPYPAWMPDGKYCRDCDYARHICPGCGASVPHGRTACVGCRAR